MNRYVKKFEDVSFEEQKPVENEPLELAKKCHQSTKECEDMCREEGKEDCAVSCGEAVHCLELYIYTIEHSTDSHKDVAELTHEIITRHTETCREHGVEHCVEDCENFSSELQRHLKEDY